MSYDLHLHSTCSDGSLSPQELVRKAKLRGLTGISLTDHDSILGLTEAALEAEQIQLDFLPGIELSTDYGALEIHILGYNFDSRNPALITKLKTIIASRNERARLMVQKLNQQGIPLTWEQVCAQTTGQFVGRNHIYRALEDAGLIKHMTGGPRPFDYYLGKKSPAYVPHQEIDTMEAITLILEAGGVPVLAHPGRMGDDSMIPRLVDSGLKGLEVYYPTHSSEMEAKYRGLAKKYGLVVTGGSDYHGTFSQTRIGDSRVTDITGLKTAFQKIIIKK
ncbi:MAG TPA: PHP domain-containing protein [Bacillota bacterium]|nr:PHP domain-containing protein [Bacillota bacterium]